MHGMCTLLRNSLAHRLRPGLPGDPLPWECLGSNVTYAWGCSFQLTDDWTDIHG